jgi:serine protease Do
LLKRTLAVWIAGLTLAGCCGLSLEAAQARTVEGTARLKELSQTLEELSDRTGRSVVQIFVRSYVATDDTDRVADLLSKENVSGSGILLTADGYILTNAHVVRGAHEVKVQLNVRAEAQARESGDRSLSRPIPGKVIGIDRDSDLALVKIDKTNLPYLMFGDSDELKQGQIVLALGNPLGLDNSVSMGVVSAISRQIKSDDPMVYIQTDAPINPGNSGGPLLDADGKVVGVNTLIFSQSGGSEGIGFAIPSSIAREVYAQLKSKGHVHRAQLGLVGQTITPEMADGLSLETDHGIVISDLDPKGPAAHAGVQADDIITGLNGKSITSRHELEAYIFRLAPGTTVTLRLERGTSEMTLPVLTAEESGGELDSLADLVDPAKNVVPELGIVGLDINKTVMELMPDLRRPAGVVVAARKTNAPYSGPLLQAGDVIYELNRHVVNGVDQLRNALSRMKSGQSLVLLIERSGHLLYIPLSLD